MNKLGFQESVFVMFNSSTRSKRSKDQVVLISTSVCDHKLQPSNLCKLVGFAKTAQS